MLGQASPRPRLTATGLLLTLLLALVASVAGASTSSGGSASTSLSGSASNSASNPASSSDPGYNPDPFIGGYLFGGPACPTCYGFFELFAADPSDPTHKTAFNFMMKAPPGAASGDKISVHVHEFGDMRNFAFSSPGNYFDPYLTDDCTYNHHGDFGTTLIYNSSGQIPGETDKLWSIHRLLVPANGDSYFRLSHLPEDAGYPIGRGIIVTKSIDECRSVNLANTFREPETNVLAYGVFGHTTLTNPAEYTPLDKTKYPVSKAVATFVTSITHGPRDYAVSGFATFVEAKNNSVDVDVRLAGLEPEAWYSLHIHRWSYYLNDLDYAYGHYNPTGAAHGCLDSAERHAGDFGAFQADAQGRIHTQFNAPGISVHSAPSSSFLLGRSLILHYGKDDCVTNPAGNSGPRVGGAPIGVMNPDPRLNAGSSLSAPTALIGSVAVLLGLLLSAF